MAYGDTTDPKNRVISIVLVGLFTVTMGYGLVNGLNISVVKKIAEKLDVVDIKEEAPPEEPPPPPPDTDLPPPPPVVTPPSPIPPPSTANVVQSVPVAPPTPPPPVFVPPAPPPPPATPDLSQSGSPRGNPGRWATNDDYPARAMRDGREGTTGFRVTYGADGRVTGCDVTASSGHSDLDAETCKLITRRARFNAGKDRDGNPTGGTYSNRVRWQIPE
ncbi:MAG TPA: energy transducer TonB [Sphingopyxis sp.]|nr:energy transducer TonB [Sphingopyxis sp.]